MSLKKKITPLTVVMKGKISDIDQNIFLHQVVNMLFSAVKLGILTWGGGGGSMGLTPFWSRPPAASRWSAVLVTSVLASRETVGGCRLVLPKAKWCINSELQKITIKIKMIMAVHQNSMSSVCQKEHRFYAPFTQGAGVQFFLSIWCFKNTNIFLNPKNLRQNEKWVRLVFHEWGPLSIKKESPHNRLNESLGIWIIFCYGCTLRSNTFA